MKTLGRTILIIVFITLYSNAMAQNTNTMGTDFWVAFMDNIDTMPGAQTLSIFAAAERTCHCSSCVISAEVVIYQRWGDFLCRFDGLTGSWDGTYQGRPCPQGTYVYQVTYKISGKGRSGETSAYRESEQKPIFGSVTLLR